MKGLHGMEREGEMASKAFSISDELDAEDKSCEMILA